MSISFHVGGGDLGGQAMSSEHIGIKANFARISTLAFLDNGRCLADLILSGIPHRFPRLPLVSVESGVGWIPFVLEALDWQWKNNGVTQDHPEWDLLPSEYFRRQIFASFWFEEDGVAKALELYPDNILFETDYPHPTCQAPGPASAGTHPRLYAEKALAGVPEATARSNLQQCRGLLRREEHPPGNDILFLEALPMRVVWLGWEEIYTTRRVQEAAKAQGQELDACNIHDVSFSVEGGKANAFAFGRNLLECYDGAGGTHFLSVHFGIPDPCPPVPRSGQDRH